MVVSKIQSIRLHTNGYCQSFMLVAHKSIPMEHDSALYSGYVMDSNNI